MLENTEILQIGFTPSCVELRHRSIVLDKEVIVLRKILIVSVGIVLLLGGLITLASAHNIANTSQKGSLLIFPKIMAYGDEEGDTSSTRLSPSATTIPSMSI